VPSCAGGFRRRRKLAWRRTKFPFGGRASSQKRDSRQRVRNVDWKSNAIDRGSRVEIEDFCTVHPGKAEYDEVDDIASQWRSHGKDPDKTDRLRPSFKLYCSKKLGAASWPLPVMRQSNSPK